MGARISTQTATWFKTLGVCADYNIVEHNYKDVPEIVALAVLGCRSSTTGCMTDVEGIDVGEATEALSTGLVWQSSSSAERYARCADTVSSARQTDGRKRGLVVNTPRLWVPA
jgi:hypothetical protein